MSISIFERKMSSFQIIIAGFFIAILIGAVLLMLPVSSSSGQGTSFIHALFTSTSAMCVTGLVVEDTASYWSIFGQAVILLLIQIGGLGVAVVTALFVSISGGKISLLQRSTLQGSISAHNIGGVMGMTWFIFKVAFIMELLGAIVMLPTFCEIFGSSGIWVATFHSISAFCNAGFDLMGEKTGAFDSLISLSNNVWVVLPICLLIVSGGLGFVTWSDIATNKFRLKRYMMQSKAILAVTVILIFLPALFFFLFDFSTYPLWDRLSLSFFQAITPRTAGFNTVDLSSMTSAGRAVIAILMLIGGSPGSTAGGVKVTTIAVLFANMYAVFWRKKNAQFFGRRIDDSTIKSGATIMIMYVTLVISGALAISTIENLPMGVCLFESISAIATVGLSLGITPTLSSISHVILILLMFLGRVGGLTLIFALISKPEPDVSQCPVEKIMVG